MKKLISFLVCVCMYAGTHAQSNLDAVLKRFNNKILYNTEYMAYPCVLKVVFETDGSVSINIDPSYNKDKTSDYGRLEADITKVFSATYKKVENEFYASSNPRDVGLMYIDGTFYFFSSYGTYGLHVTQEIAKTRDAFGAERETAKNLYKKVYQPKTLGTYDANTGKTIAAGEIMPNSLKNRKLTKLSVKGAKKDNESAFLVVDDKEKEFYSVNIKDEDVTGTIPINEFIVTEISTSEQTAKSGRRVYSVYPLGHPQLTQKYSLEASAKSFPNSITYKGRNGKDAMKPTYSGNSVKNLLNEQTGKSVNGNYGYIGDNGTSAGNKDVKIALFTHPVDNKKCLQVSIDNKDFFLVPLDRTFTIDASGGNGGNGSDGLKGLEEGEYTRGLKKIKTKGSDKNGDGGNGGNAGSGGNVTLTYDPSVEPYLKNIIINVDAGEIGRGGSSPAGFQGVATGVSGKNGYAGSKGTITKNAAPIKAGKITINLDTFTSSKEEATTGGSLIPESKKYVGVDASTLGGASAGTTTGGASNATGALKVANLGSFTPFEKKYISVTDVENDNLLFYNEDNTNYNVYNTKTKKTEIIAGKYSGKITNIYKSPSGKWSISQGTDFYLRSNLQNPTEAEKERTTGLNGEGGILFELPAKNMLNADVPMVHFGSYGDNGKSNIKVNFLKKGAKQYDWESEAIMMDSKGQIYNNSKYYIELVETKHWKDNYFVFFTRNYKVDGGYSKGDLQGNGIYVVKVDKKAKIVLEVINGTEINQAVKLEYSIKDGFKNFLLNTTNNTASAVYNQPSFNGSKVYEAATHKLSTTPSAVITDISPFRMEVETERVSDFQPYKGGFMVVTAEAGAKLNLTIIDAKGKTISSVVAATGEDSPKYRNYALTQPKAGKAFLVLMHNNAERGSPAYDASVLEITGL